ncbi:hypothetical protein, partial [Cnuella takakiae]|uniref:hypothetical protein n=1 Tax=Cnuella takakiae TaxID=1302690 RepID=UPI001C1F8436
TDRKRSWLDSNPSPTVLGMTGRNANQLNYQSNYVVLRKTALICKSLCPDWGCKYRGARCKRTKFFTEKFSGGMADRFTLLPNKRK